MKRGLVIGKFLPLHNGHVALIRFASGQCDELIVSMTCKDDDPIDPALRFSWIREIFGDQPAIKTEMVKDDFDDETLDIPERTRLWAAFIRKRFPKIDMVFSSEEYGEDFGKALGIPHMAFDVGRTQVPVSATLIRKDPFLYWTYIPEAVRPYFVRKICFYGPESTGKSTLVERLAQIYQTEFVPEVARELITANNFTAGDIIRIGHTQTQRVLEKTRTANKILFCDTDVITTEIYSRHYLNHVPPVLYELEKRVKYDLYFLFDIDVPWVPDGLRDLGHMRDVMFSTFRAALEERSIPFTLVSGNYHERERLIIAKIDSWLKNESSHL